ncbi:hypothetical protein AGLY_001330 [Aphis glycines]|uniref:Uncharacterized protein n=1 Tax=Aphis glycines TaxID=307491 RepID=A0A6G0U9Z8_APHGL|nr:hypothetical protein AGLY_001330 [Aphis glycines]
MSKKLLRRVMYLIISIKPVYCVRCIQHPHPNVHNYKRSRATEIIAHQVRVVSDSKISITKFWLKKKSKIVCHKVKFKEICQNRENLQVILLKNSTLFSISFPSNSYTENSKRRYREQCYECLNLKFLRRCITITNNPQTILNISQYLKNSERSDECIDFTMIITSRNNAPISNYGGGFRCKSEYPWCIIEIKNSFIIYE